MTKDEMKDKLLLMREAMPQGCIIMHQENHNCPQFTNQVTNPVFVFEGGTYYGNGTNKPQAPKSKEAADTTNSPAKQTVKKTAKADKQHGVTRATFAMSQMITEFHLHLLYIELVHDGWIGSQSSWANFKDLFMGRVSDCEVIWTGKIGLGDLATLFKRMQEERLIVLPASARSVNSVLENHFVTVRGHYVTGLNSSKPSVKNDDKIKGYISLLKTAPNAKEIVELYNKQAYYDI